MYALICQGEGKYYVSAVFGYYTDINAATEYERYLQSCKRCFIIWDAEKKRLIRWPEMVQHTKFLIKQLLVVDADKSNWHEDGKGGEFIGFLNRKLLDSLLDAETQPEDVLEKCRALDVGYVYEECREIRSETDITDLMCASGGFHDAYIEEEELQDDGTLHLLFDGTWGCKIEVWLWGDLEYDTSYRDSDDYDHIWFGSTVIRQNGFIYFIADEDMTVENIYPGECFFKARHMKYRIIPD